MKKNSYYRDVIFFGLNMMFLGARITSNDIGLTILHGVCAILLFGCLVFKDYEK